MATTLGYALLGLLARAPLSGYDIAGQLRAGIGPFWHARHSQIYPELARLESDGLVSHERVVQQDRPDKKVFSITPRGAETLRAWLTSPLDAPPIRDELTLRAYSIWLVEPARGAAFFKEQAEQHRAQLAIYEQYRAEMERESTGQLQQHDAPEFASYATLRRGIAYERELVEWCTWLAETLAGERPAANGLTLTATDERRAANN